MKKYLKVSLLFLLLVNIITLCSCKKEKDVQKSFPEIVTNLKSYKLSGKLESMFPSGNKECEVVAYYKSPNLYRVELKNVGNNEPQIMIKNQEGIYVLLPSVNKMFKINSSWPNNSSYPYLLQSLSKDIVSDEQLLTSKDENTTTLEFNAKLFDNAVAIKQKAIFDNKTGLPKEVLVYDEKDTLITRFVVSNIEIDIDIDKKLFEVNSTMTENRQTYINSPIAFDRVVSYPTYYPEGATMQSENILGSANEKKVIMKYGGENPFTIIESYIVGTETLKTEYLDATIYTMGGAMCFIANNTIKFYDNGMEYILASTTIDYPTLIQMGESLRTADLK